MLVDLNKFLIFIMILLGTNLGAYSMSQPTTSIIKTYMPFGLTVDPAHIRTLVDLDLSYALASTLVGWSDSKEIVAGLAESWTFVNETEVVFKIRKNAKWSNGEMITADQVVNSLKRAQKVYGAELSSLFDSVLEIKSKNSNEVFFVLKDKNFSSGILGKLTEPMYGTLYLNKNGTINLNISSGPFYLKSFDKKELQMSVNKFWYNYQNQMASDVIVRQFPEGEELQEKFLHDSWANLMTGSSFGDRGLIEKYQKENYAFWRRSLDKIFFFFPSPKLISQDSRDLFLYLNKKINRQIVTRDLSGYELSNQFFPPGYILNDPEFYLKISDSNIKLPETFIKKSLVILATASRVSEKLRSNIANAIKEVTGIAPQFKLVSLNDFEKTRVEGNYDFAAGTLAVSDPHYEGAVSFYFGLTPSIIPDGGADKYAFKKRVENNRNNSNEEAKISEYRKIFSDATNAGCILPLFHYSTVAIAKGGMDLSLVPTSDETVSFSKVRFNP